jgi:hypothetical protein
MKKYILGLCLALVAFASYGQLTSNITSTIHMKTSLTSSVDSVVVTNTGTSHLYIGFTTKKALSIQPLITVASGTGAGTMTLYGSNDGVSWFAVTDATSTPTITTYTVTNTGTYAAPQTTIFNLGTHKYAAYRLTHVGSGTMVTRFKAIVFYE